MPKPIQPKVRPLPYQLPSSRKPQPTISPEVSRYLNIAPALQSQFAEHVKTWSNCYCCPLEATRRKVVIFRGSLPCDILFIGEAPGESEDSMGVPFIGAAGDLLTKMWCESLKAAGYTERWPDGGYRLKHPSPMFGVTNILACIPRNPSDCGTGEIRKPHKDEAAQCQPRLLEILDMANPRIIILLGDVAKRFYPAKLINAKKVEGAYPRFNGVPLLFFHPARILHLEDEDPRAASLLQKKFVLALTSALESLR